MNAAQLISEFAKILNQFGPESSQAEAFISQHSSDEEFVELAHLSIALKRALMPQVDENARRLANADAD